MNSSAALKLASLLVDYTNRYCDSVAVAGSVRRAVPECKDIEIVAIPRWEDRPNTSTLFSQLEPVNLLHEFLSTSEFIKWIKPGTAEIIEWPIKPDGKYWRGLIKQGKFGAPADIKLDLFLARRENLGVIYTIRTGSADFSRELVTYARDHTEYRVEGGDLKYRGEVVPCPDEETLFQALNLQWVTPDSRGGKQDLIILR